MFPSLRSKIASSVSKLGVSKLSAAKLGAGSVPSLMSGLRNATSGRVEDREQQGERRRRRRPPPRAPLGDSGFSSHDALDFSLDAGTKLFGRSERRGKMGGMPGLNAPVTSRLPAAHVSLGEANEVCNETETVVQVRAWVSTPDGERWRGVRLPRHDATGLPGEYQTRLAPGESLQWQEAPEGVLLSFHEESGRPASLDLGFDGQSSAPRWSLHAPAGAQPALKLVA